MAVGRLFLAPAWHGSLLALPCFIDGLAQYRWGHESTNLRRIITGFVAGCGIEMVVRAIVEQGGNPQR